MNTVELLEAARALIATPATWTKCASARNAHGRKVSSVDLAASCWCASGALLKCLNFDERAAECTLREAEIALSVAANKLGADKLFGPGYVGFNDHSDTSHADVLAMFDDAIAAEKAKVSA